MGLEAATYIDDLVASNPLGTDSKAQGDNHIRLIKNVLKNQFPNLGAEAVTATAADINDLFDSNRAMPTGGIIMWSGAATAVPTGWAICDGTNGTPNLVGKFIVGSKSDAGETYDIGDTGGAETHTHTVDGGAHTHTVPTSGWTINTSGLSPSQGLQTSIANRLIIGSGLNEIAENLETLRNSQGTNTSGSTAHTHDVTSESSLPPYYALAYIMKL